MIRAQQPMHGRVSDIRHEATGLFEGLPEPLRATRYHSLVVDPESPGDRLRVTARTEEGEIMGLAAADAPLWGVQFHPEAIRTEEGHRLLANFLALGRAG